MKITKKKPITKKKKSVALATVKKTKNTPAYYRCLATKASQGCLKGKVGKMCHECKEQSSVLTTQRNQEIKKLGSAYKQIGVSITKLLAN